MLSDQNAVTPYLTLLKTLGLNPEVGVLQQIFNSSAQEAGRSL